MGKSLLCNISQYFILVSFIFSGCGGGSSGQNTKSDLARDFDKTKSVAALRASILTIPANVQLTSVASSGKKIRFNINNKAVTNDGLAGNMYGSIGTTIKYSNEIKDNIKEFLEFIFESKDLANAETGKLIENDVGAITAFQIDDLAGVSGETYKWKLSLYFLFSNEPEIICRFSFVDGKMKGQMLQSFSEFASMQVDGFNRNYQRYYKYDIRFDGTKIPQTLDIDYIIDNSSVLLFAEFYYRNLTDEQKDELDLLQTGKSSIRVKYDGAEYGISGSNYIPGDNLEARLNGLTKIFGEDHSTYTFRTKSITGAIDGAKMEVAIPADTLEDISTIWQTNAFAALFEKVVLDFLNEYITQLVDTIDDEYLINRTYLGSALLNSVDFDGTVIQEQQLGFEFLTKFLGEELEVPTLAAHGLVMTIIEYDAATAFWGSSSFTNFNINTLDELNTFLADTNTVNSLTDKNEVYYRVMAPAIVEYYQTNPTGITITNVETTLTAINDSKANDFKKLIETNKLIVNPAFFEKDNGLLGTFDGTNFYNYDWIFDKLTLGDKPINFDTFNALDLTTLEPIKPNDVYNLSIEVK